MIPSLNAATAGAGLPFDQYVELAAQSGFAGVDFSIAHAAAYEQEHGFDATAALFETHKVLPANMGLPVEWRKDQETFDKELAQLPRLARLAQDLDCTRCGTYVHPATDEPVSQYAARAKDRLTQVAKVLADQGIRFGLEFLGPAHFRPDPEKVWFYDLHGCLDMVEEIESEARLENLGILLDSWHWYTSSGSMMDLAAVPLEKIIHVHINDAPDIAREKQQDQVRLLPGESGVVDLVGFLKTLSALGYDGPVAVETFSAKLRELPPADAARLAHKAVMNAFNAAGVKPMKLV